MDASRTISPNRGREVDVRTHYTQDPSNVQSGGMLANGSLVRLSSWAVATVLRAEVLPDSTVILADPQTAGSLRVRPNGAIDTQGGRGVWARFWVHCEPDDETAIRLQNVGHQEQRGTAVFLTASIVPADQCPAAAPLPEPPAVLLSDEQKAAFVRDGFLVVRGIVGRDLIDAALRAINHQLGQGSAAWEQDDDGKEKLAGEVGSRHSAAIHNLLHASPARGLAEQLIAGELSPQVGGQIALRFPLPEGRLGRPPKHEDQWHIDGMKKHAHMSPFQLLLGIALSSQADDDCGNLCVWPTHHTIVAEAVQRAHVASLSSTGHDSSTGDEWCGHRPALPAENATQVRLEPGDVVLAHQKLPHRVGLNRSPKIRYQVYFRLSSRQHDPATAAQQGLWENWRVRPE
mmetsp:Transcript_8147/g.26231  ORF Transcript_8147/g.26231 Transcript_8147/m.26231 type:complete len:402 (+) Transcript_8147:1-1206(+)